ncbi:MAG: Nramp family divalent metal transporter [Bacteroidota bacterium]
MENDSQPNRKFSFRNVLFWSIISAAFIGPGTVTTASKAGASFGLGLLWALIFSIIATILLQESSARLTIASGLNLGQVIKKKYGTKRGKWITYLLFISIAVGCAAYQAGNLLGAASGILLTNKGFDINIVLILIALFVSVLLWNGKYKTIANILGVVVALMGGLFIFVAFNSNIGSTQVIEAITKPEFSSASSLLVIGLIGTTIVPYNLFLGSGIGKGQSISEMRSGISFAVIIGGLISIAILVVGTQVIGEYSFENLASTLSENIGSWAAVFFAYGLFAAGFTSSITAPFAAAVTAQTLFQNDEDKSWNSNSRKFRSIWLTILWIGVLFGITGVKPIPAIIAAQALNGLLLPIVAFFLIEAINDETIISKKYSNPFYINLLLLLVLLVCCFLGLNNIFSALQKIGILERIPSTILQLIKSILSILIVAWSALRLFSKKTNPNI